MVVNPIVLLLIPYVVVTGMLTVALLVGLKALPRESRKMLIVAFAILDGLLTLALVLGIVFWAVPVMNG